MSRGPRRSFLTIRARRFAGLVLGLVLATAPVMAAPEDALSGLPAVADSQLDEMRGGFEIDGGLKMSFGIERVSYINGVLVSAQTVNVPDLPAASQSLVSEALARVAGMGLIQNGNGNSFRLDADANLIGNVIQNTTDNQKIVTRTVINSAVNSLQLLRSINLQSAVRDGIVNGLRR